MLTVRHLLVQPRATSLSLAQLRSVRPSATRLSPIPSIQTSLLTAVPAWLGQMLPGLRNVGVRAYRARSAPENPVSAAPASAAGTNGTSRADPTAISPAASDLLSRLHAAYLSQRHVLKERKATRRESVKGLGGLLIATPLLQP